MIEKEIIHEQVGVYCKERDITPLIVADCGSRAWNYNTPKSDYDVKVLFVHNDPNKYRSLWEPKDNYSHKPDVMRDYSYWDIGKFLHLLWKGNAQTYELIASPKVYYSAYEANNLFDFTINACNERLEKVAYHYYGLATKTYKQSLAGTGEPSLKKYIYAMRSLLYMKNIAEYKELPELDFYKFIFFGNGADHIKSHTVLREIRAIMKLVKSGNNVENKSYPNIDKYLADELEYWKVELSTRFLVEEKGKNLLTSAVNFDRMYHKFTK